MGKSIKLIGKGLRSGQVHDPVLSPEQIATLEITPPPPGTKRLSWIGEIPPQKWMNFYTKVLSKFAGDKGLKITLSVDVAQEGGISSQKIKETKAALRELGLKDDLEVK